MSITRFAGWILSVCLLVLGAGVVCGQTTSTGSGQSYPSKPIRIVTGGVGGGLDLVARLVAQGLIGSLGQPVIVENRSGFLSAETVAKAPPDGYTLLLAGGTFVTGPMIQKASYDPVKDFIPISLISGSPSVLVVHSSLPVKSVKELIALAKARPGELDYSSTGTGGAPHLALELFKSMTGVNIVHIPYKSAGQSITDLVAGRVQLAVSNPVTIAPFVKSGKLHALAVTSLEPSALLPGLPTVAATVPGYELVAINGMLAPAKTPVGIINQLNQEIVRIANQAEVKKKFFDEGYETVGSSPQQYAAEIKSQAEQLSKVIKDAGIRVD